MNLFEVCFLIINVLYIFFNIFLIAGWLRTTSPYVSHTPKLFVSVIIVVRNEEKNIFDLLNDLKLQSYDHKLFELIIIDDHSEDETLKLISNFIAHSNFSVQLFELKNFITGNYIDNNFKKKAIEIGVNHSSGEIILNTDGDCRLETDWIKTFADFFLTSGAQCISGPVTFYKEKNIFEKLQTIEFASLIASGTASLNFGFASMCNGANFAYTKKAFLEVDGFAGTANIPSGDDIFLMQKIHSKYPKKVFFIKNKNAIVKTEAQANIIFFYNQRLRWASKWNMYKDWKISLMAIFVFISNAALFVSSIAVLFSILNFNLFLTLILSRFAVEILFLIFVLRFLNKTGLIILIPLVQIFYSLYVFYFGLISFFKLSYRWKERKINSV